MKKGQDTAVVKYEFIHGPTRQMQRAMHMRSFDIRFVHPTSMQFQKLVYPISPNLTASYIGQQVTLQMGRDECSWIE